MKKNGNELEKNLVRFIEEQKQINQRLEKMLEEQQKLMKEEQKLKKDHEQWLRDHNVRLGLHWEEISRQYRHK